MRTEAMALQPSPPGLQARNTAGGQSDQTTEKDNQQSQRGAAEVDNEDVGEDAVIPLYYRLPLLYIEPICALHGAWLLISSPSSFLNIVSPSHALAMASFASSSSSASSLSSNATTAADAAALSNGIPVQPYSLDSVRIITDQLGIMQLVFAFNLAVVLRATQRDAGTWRLMCTGMLLSDLLHVAASVREFGFEALATPWRWRSHDWANFVILVGMAAVRLGVVLGIGLPKRCGRRRGAGGRTTVPSSAAATQKDKHT